MTDYSKGLIYLIKQKDDINNENCYFGSTTNFKARKALHKCDCNNENRTAYNNEKYKYIRANGGWINFIMLEIEKFSCKSKTQLTKREDDVMCEYKIRLNDRRACRSNKEYYQDNKEEIAEQRKEHYQNHKEEYQEKHKKYYENHKEEIAEKNKEHYQNQKEEIAEQRKKHYENHKEEIAEKNKEHYQNHKEEIKETNKKHYQNHKEEIAEKNKEKITCECGCIISKRSMTRHKKSVKHLQHIFAKNNEV